MMLPLYIFTDQARKYTACLTKHDSGMFGHMANENRNSSWKRGLRLTQRTVNVSSSLVIGMHHRSDGPDYGIVLKDTSVCQRGQRVHKLTRWRNRLRADFLHPAWIVKGQWEEAFSKRKKTKQFRSVHYGGNWKCKSSCYLHVSCPHLSPRYPADT